MEKKGHYTLKIIIFLWVGFTVASKANAASYQFFKDFCYANPNTLQTVKKLDVVLGNTVLEGDFRFTGSNGPFLQGSVRSDQWDNLPYGRLAFRVNKLLVVGLDITTPIWSNVLYPRDSFARFASTRTVLRDYCLSPRFSILLSRHFAFGAGFLADNLYNAQIGFAVPPFELVNKSRGSDWAYGWLAGLTYMGNYTKGNPTTLVNLSYYSRLIHSPVGTSTWGPFTNPNFTATAILPAVYSLNVTQFFSKEWLVSATVRYVEWGALRNLFIQNTAIGGGPTNLNLPLHYHNSWSTELATHYQFKCNPKLGISGALFYETSPQPTRFRPIGLPAYKIWGFGIGPDYAINKCLTVKLLYLHGSSNPPINSVNPVGPLVGNMNVRGNLFDLSIAYRI